MNDNPLVVACISAFNGKRTISGVVARALKYVDRVVVCDDGSRDPKGAIAIGLLASSAGLRALVGVSKVVLRSGVQI